MCDCHHVLDNDTVVKQLTNALQHCEYADWNSTSLSHLLMIVRGCNGSEAHSLALQLVEKFYIWYEIAEPIYASHNMSVFAPRSSIRTMIDEACNVYKNEYKK